MLVVTGGAGFIGSVVVAELNQRGYEDIIIVDELGTGDKWKNIAKRKYHDYIHKSDFLELIANRDTDFDCEAVIHLGACSSTTEQNADFLYENNYRYSRILAEWAIEEGIRFVYASSAATYGDGEMGFSDDEEEIEELLPLNMYAYSKQLFDVWALRNEALNQITGIKFFNVFGPNEYHKEDMKSLVFKAFHQVKDEGKIRLFKSHRDDYGDGDQVRDFIYVKDCARIVCDMLTNEESAGLFNLGTGAARSWNDLAKAVFSAMGKKKNIEYIEMPEILRDRYQYRTEAEMFKMEDIGIDLEFTSLEDAVADYINNYLATNDPYL